MLLLPSTYLYMYKTEVIQELTQKGHMNNFGPSGRLHSKGILVIVLFLLGKNSQIFPYKSVSSGFI